jgi:hypothetical protein
MHPSDQAFTLYVVLRRFAYGYGSSELFRTILKSAFRAQKAEQKEILR